MVLLLTTTGRRTGLPRVTPLQYEEVDGTYYIGCARADWFRNLTADPNVEIRVKSKKFRATAETITDPSLIANFLELRLRNHPTIVGKILQAEGLPAHPGREQLENYGKRIAVAAIHPQENTQIWGGGGSTCPSVKNAPPRAETAQKHAPKTQNTSKQHADNRKQ